MFLIFSQFVLYLGILLSIFILTRLLLLKTKTLISFLQISCFVLEVVLGTSMIFFLFSVATINFFKTDINPTEELISYHCKYYIMSWHVFWTSTASLNLGIIFTRYLYIRYNKHSQLPDPGCCESI